MPQISVIVPVYNVEKYLPRCVDSILAQTFTDSELILVDDGSPDNCGAICDEYANKDTRVKVIHKKNGGVSSARNAGLDACCAPYVTFCDSDDYWAPEWLDSLYSALLEQNADVVSAGLRWISEDGELLSSTTLPEGSYEIASQSDHISFILNQILSGELGWEVCTRIFKTKYVNEHNIRFCESCGNYAEDACFVLEYSLYCNKAATSSADGYFYIQHSSSMMANSVDVVKFNQVNEVSKQFGERLKSMNRSLFKKYFALLHYMIMRGEYRKVFQTHRENSFLSEARRIKNQKWYRKNARRAFCTYPVLYAYLGKIEAREALLISSYCLYGTWPLFHLLFELKNKLRAEPGLFSEKSN